jgi:hypothetical protein
LPVWRENEFSTLIWPGPECVRQLLAWVHRVRAGLHEVLVPEGEARVVPLSDLPELLAKRVALRLGQDLWT